VNVLSVITQRYQSHFVLLVLQLLFCSAIVGFYTNVVHADQSESELDVLFSALGKATSNYETNQIQNEIWQQWLLAPDDNANLLMSQLHAAMSSGQHNFALEICNQLVDSNPGYAEAWNKLLMKC